MSGPRLRRSLLYKVPACALPLGMNPPHPALARQPGLAGITSDVLHDAPQVLLVANDLVVALFLPERTCFFEPLVYFVGCIAFARLKYPLQGIHRKRLDHQ